MPSLKLRATAIGTLLLCTAVSSSALTLGRVRGAALIGRPLDVVIQVQLEGPDEQASNLCFDADVFHADTKQDPSRVRVTVETNEAAGISQIRVQSATVVDEPIVTIYLRAGCSNQKATRRYVLLADLPSEVAAPVVPLVTPSAAPPAPAPVAAPTDKLSGPSPYAAAGRPATGEAAASGATATLKAPPASAPVQAAAPKVRKPPTPKPPRTQAPPPPAAKVQPPAAAPSPAPAPAPAPTPAPAPAAAAKPPASAPAPAPALAADSKAKPGQPRLRLDPLESLSERVATLEATSPNQAQSEEAARDAARVKSLESDVKALLALAAKNEVALTDLRMRLAKSESERFSVVWIYVLSALVLACLAAVALLWTRSKRTEGQDPSERADWWRAAPPPAPAVAAPVAGSAAAPLVDTAAQSSQPGDSVPAKAVLAPSLLAPLDEVDVNLVDMDDSMFDKMMKTAGGYKKPEAQKDEPAPAGTQRRTVDSEELMDVRQQAEFFVSLGQTDQAIQVLEKRIAKGDCGPLMYLDLLSIFHGRNLKTDYRQVRDEFNRLFNGHVPDFVAFKEEGRGIDAYPSVFAHIVALWPSAKVLEIIETCIFRDSWDDRDQAFDLYAFRDLLLLYAIAKGISEGQYGDAPVSAPAPLRPSEILQLTPSHFDAVNQPTMAFTARPVPPEAGSQAPAADLPLDLTLDPLDEAPPPVTAKAGKGGKEAGGLDLDLSDTELGTIYSPSFTSPTPLSPSGQSTPAPLLDMPAVEGSSDDDLPSLMDFELPEPPPPTPPKPKSES
jgi:hypothetical protein